MDDYQRWISQRIGEASAIIALCFVATFVLVAILRHWLPSAMLYLFLWDVVHQILFYVGGVLALVETLLLRFLNTPLQRKVFTGLVLLCLFVACFQAWVDDIRTPRI